MACTENSEDEDELLAIGEAMKPMSLSVGLRERSRAEKVEWAQMISGSETSHYRLFGALLGLFYVLAARESVGGPVLIASLVLWWAWLADSR